MILGMKCTTKVKSVVSILYHLLVASADLHLHILRCLYIFYTQMHCLQNVTVDPTNYGYELKNGSLVPIYHQNNMSEMLVQTCSCKKCLTKHCACRRIVVPCCVYCKCKNNISGQFCMNSHVFVSVPVTL